MLEARGVPAAGRLIAEAEGDIEAVDRKLVISRINVRYKMDGISEQEREILQRTLERHVEYCPAAISVQRGIPLSWEFQWEE